MKIGSRWGVSCLCALMLLNACGPRPAGQSTSGGQDTAEIQVSEESTPELSERGEWVETSEGAKLWKSKSTFYDAFDTVIQLTLYTENEEQADRYHETARAEFERLHRLYDKYHRYEGVNNVFVLNEQAGGAPVVVEEELYQLIRFAKDNAPRALNKTNIAMGSVLELWHDARVAAGVYENGVLLEESHAEAGKLPEQAALQKAGAHTDLAGVVLDDAKKSVQLTDAEMSLDVGAVAKGYATELVAKKLEREGLEHGLISAGGNVRTIGSPVNGRDTWLVGIQNPDLKATELAAVLRVGANQSVVTSGDYQRYYVVDGKKYHHIIDPATRMPGTYFASVSVVTADSGLADFLSTALFLSTPEEAEQIRQNFPEASIDVLWIDASGRQTATEGMKAMREE